MRAHIWRDNKLPLVALIWSLPLQLGACCCCWSQNRAAMRRDFNGALACTSSAVSVLVVLGGRFGRLVIILLAAPRSAPSSSET